MVECLSYGTFYHCESTIQLTLSILVKGSLFLLNWNMRLYASPSMTGAHKVASMTTDVDEFLLSGRYLICQVPSKAASRPPPPL